MLKNLLIENIFKEIKKLKNLLIEIDDIWFQEPISIDKNLARISKQWVYATTNRIFSHKELSAKELVTIYRYLKNKKVYFKKKIRGKNCIKIFPK